MIRREIPFKTENRNTIISVLLHKNDFNNLNLSHIKSGHTELVKIVSFNIKNFIHFFELVLKLS